MKKEEVAVEHKEIGLSSIQYPMLDSINYTVWSIQMKITLKINEVSETIEVGTKGEDNNNMAINLLFQSIPDTLILQLRDFDTTKAVCVAIKVRHVGADRVEEERLKILMAEFDRIKMKGADAVDMFVGKLPKISSKCIAFVNS